MRLWILSPVLAGGNYQRLVSFFSLVWLPKPGCENRIRVELSAKETPLLTLPLPRIPESQRARMKRNVKLRLHNPTGHAPSNTPHKAPPLTTPTACSLPVGTATAVWSSGEGSLCFSCLLAGLTRSLRVCLRVSICVSVSCDLSLCASH